MTYIPNQDFADDFQKSDAALELVDRLAEATVPVAFALAPKDREFLADSIRAESGLVAGVATGRVNAFDFKAAWKEFGTRREAAQPFLRPAMEATTGRPVKGGDK